MQSPLDFFARAARTSPSAAAANVEFAAGHKNMLQLIELRWIAVIGQVTTIAVAILLFGIALPLVHMLQVLSCLIAFNIASHLCWHERRPVSNGEMFMAILVDVSSLTVLLYLSGGTTNPFAFLYLLQVIVSAVLLDVLWTWSIVAITITCMAGLAAFAEPLALPFDHERGIGSLYVQGLLVCFALNAGLLVLFVSRISDNVRDKATQLAALRQSAAEEEHIVRMGLLASGAAHELGTPLATLAVILGDWRRMPVFTADPELLQEVGEMQTQILRCKAIVSGILMSAGEARGESPVKTTIRTFLNDLVTDWRATRPAAALIYDNRFGLDMPMVSDSALKQMVSNVLDNALEASAQKLSLAVARDDHALILTVTDDGTGFADAMLVHFGKPYQSSKGQPGRGLGLFLVVNVARTLGGSVTARNKPEGGAVVTITLPLQAITLEENETDGYRAPAADH